MFREKIIIISIIVISGPDDNSVTLCEGEEAVFTCILNSNIGNNEQWYRYRKDTGTTEIVDPNGVNTFIHTQTGNTINTSLIITNAINSYTGYYRVGSSYFHACYVSLIVTASM